MPRIKNPFGCKRCQKSVKMWATNSYKSFFQKYFVVHEQSAVKNPFSGYVWIKVDSYLCDFLYVYLEGINVRLNLPNFRIHLKEILRISLQPLKLQ